MINKELARRELAKEEGLKIVSYKCTAGKVTVGLGHNCESMPTLPIIGRSITKVGQRITPAELEKLFDHDFELIKNQINRYLPWVNELDDARSYVIVSMLFNLGISRLLKFAPTLMLIQDEEYAKAVVRLKRTPWYIQVKRRSRKLCDILITGEIPE
jgi:lysozyme